MLMVVAKKEAAAKKKVHFMRGETCYSSYLYCMYYSFFKVLIMLMVVAQKEVPVKKKVHIMREENTLYQLLVCMYCSVHFQGADYADGGSTEGSTSKEKGTYNE